MEFPPDRMRKEYMLPDIDSTFRVFAAHWRTVAGDWTYPLHHHPLFEVNLVLSGVQEMSVNGRKYVQKPGDLMLLNPVDQHESRVIGREEMTYYCLHFDVDERSFRELLCRNRICFHKAGSILADAVRPALNKLLELTSDETASRVDSRMRILSALFELFAGLSGTLSEQESQMTPTRNAQTASKVAALLEREIEGALDGSGDRFHAETIASIAAMVGYSTSAMNRIFTEVYGMSPRQYMSTLMLKKSKLLLMDPELSVEAVSIRLGYKNIAHFSRQFKRWTGESPSRFRDRYHK
ncbi:helix-turn-helix domain-containing protein [Paenibacillus sp. HJL G12]|uniref:Helix-turn-helix domain-containing protein n=1 Tax=Paenibacillus dendrobii TaxID=2691084 RepID=A0A7X3IHG1_9BACL|nr:AraC family transcriptional regulator [Paenibacillus dendrobii]MWV43381.1 helix-turn-helix domain-containing protein [Paenibacillus dendrobii]